MEGRVIICIILSTFLFSIASASSIDSSDWSFRREIVLSASKAFSDYQLNISLDTKSLVAAGKMRSDCGDIRFTDSDKFSSLSYFLEVGCNTAYTILWVKVPIVYSDKKFFVYYGQPFAQSESSGTDTFLFFDGFDGNSTDTSKWFPQKCVSVYGGYAHMYSRDASCYLKLNKDLPDVGAIQLKARRGPEETGVGPGFTVSYADNLPAFEMAADPKEKRWMLYSQKPSPTNIYGGAIDLTDHIFQVAYDVSGRLYYFYADSSQIAKNRAYSPGALGSLYLLSGDISKAQSISDSYFDYFFIRKYSEKEPRVNLRDEESLKPSTTHGAPATSKPALTTTFSATSSAGVASSFSTSILLTAATQIVSSSTIVLQPALEGIRDEKNPSNASSQNAVKSLSIWSFITPILIIIFVFVLLFLFSYYRRRKLESLKENKEVLRWIANELLSGEDPEAIKKAVRDSGMDPSIVDKAKKTLK